jgi:hypothetical protein
MSEHIAALDAQFTEQLTLPPQVTRKQPPVRTYLPVSVCALRLMRCSRPVASRSLSAELWLQTPLEAEVTAFLGRHCYTRAASTEDARPGLHNGYGPTTAKTAGAG